jgi:hypothetical protein
MKTIHIFAILLAFFIIGCYDEKESFSTHVETLQEQNVSLSGKAIDGYLSGATVFLDITPNLQLDADEPYSLTDTNGNYTLVVTDTQLKNYPNIIATGGIDTATRKKFTGIIMAKTDDTASDGNIYINYLTSIVSELLTKGETLESARTRVATFFEVNPNEINSDFVTKFNTTPELYRAGIRVREFRELALALNSSIGDAELFGTFANMADGVNTFDTMTTFELASLPLTEAQKKVFFQEATRIANGILSAVDESITEAQIKLYEECQPGKTGDGILPECMYGTWVALGGAGTQSFDIGNTLSFSDWEIIDQNTFKFHTSSVDGNGNQTDIEAIWIRSGVLDTEVNAKVISNTNASLAPNRALGDIGNISVILRNLKNSAVEKTVNINSQNGGILSIKDEVLPSGDYNVTIATSGVQTQFEISFDDATEDLGNILITDTSIKVGQIDIGDFTFYQRSGETKWNYIKDPKELYNLPDTWQHLDFALKKLSFADGVDVNITVDDPIVNNFVVRDEPNDPLIKYLGFQLKDTGEDYTFNLNVSVTDSELSEPILYQVPLTVYDKKVVVDITAQNLSDTLNATAYLNYNGKLAPISFSDGNKGAFIYYDESNGQRVYNYRRAQIDIPFRTDITYTLLLTNGTTDDNYYSIGIDVSATDPDTIASNVTDTNAYEPNESNAQATVIGLNQKIDNYVAYPDLDFFTIDLTK